MSAGSLQEKTEALRRLLEETRTTVDASRLERTRQRRRIGEVVKEIEASEILNYRSSVVKRGHAEMSNLEKLSGNSTTSEKAAAVRVLLEPIAGWNEHAKNLLQLIDLQLDHNMR